LENVSKYLKKNFVVSASKIVVTSMVTLFLLPLVIKKLGLELYGVISLTLIFSGVSSILDLGLSKAVVLLSGDKTTTENKVVSSALLINGSIIAILSVIFIALQLTSVDLLGKDLNIDENDKFLVLNAGFLMLVLMLLNNLCKSILEANYLMHIVSLGMAVYTPLMYIIIFIASFFTQSTSFYILTPLVLTTLLFLVNVFIIIKRTKVKLVKVVKKDVLYVAKCTLGFLNVGLINSMVMPVMRYVFVLMTASVELYALFDLSFKIAMLANGLIVSISTPMFAVFSKKIEEQPKEMVRIANKIFKISFALYAIILLGYFLLGEWILPYLNLDVDSTKVLHDITFVLIATLGTVAVVEVYYRYFLGKNKLTKAFLLKLFIPVLAVGFFYVFNGFDLIYRFIYAYGVSLFVSAIIIVLAFVKDIKQLKMKIV
jgi:membrane protein EpsK